MKQLSIYCASVCNEKDSPGAWAALLIFGNIKKEISASFPSTNIDRLNLSSIISSIGILKEPCEVYLYINSNYVFDAISNKTIVDWEKNNWKLSNGRAVDNEDIWRMLIIQLKVKKHKVKFRKVDVSDKLYVECLNIAKKELNLYLENDIYTNKINH